MLFVFNIHDHDRLMGRSRKTSSERMFLKRILFKEKSDSGT